MFRQVGNGFVPCWATDLFMLDIFLSMLYDGMDPLTARMFQAERRYR